MQELLDEKKERLDQKERELVQMEAEIETLKQVILSLWFMESQVFQTNWWL